MKHIFRFALVATFLAVLFLCPHSVFAQHSLVWTDSLFNNDYDTLTGATDGGWMLNSTNGIAIDANGNVYVTGSFGMNGEDFNTNHPGTNVLKSKQVGCYLAKYDSRGNFIWVRTMTFVNYPLLKDYSSYGDCLSIAIDTANEIVIAGWFYDSTDFDPLHPGTLVRPGGMFFEKYDTNGNVLWEKTNAGGDGPLDYTSGVIHHVVVDSACNIYVTGSYRGSIDFNPGSGTAILTSAESATPDTVFHEYNFYNAYNVFFAKYDKNGTYVWAKSFGGRWNDFGYGIAVDAAHNVYLTGFFDGKMVFDAGSDTAFIATRDSGIVLPTGVYGSGFYIAKYDDNGNYIWAHGFGSGDASDHGVAIAVDNAGFVYVTGTFEDTIDFSNGMGIALTSPHAPNGLEAPGNTFIAKYDGNGNFGWVHSIQGECDDAQDALFGSVDVETAPFIENVFGGISIDCDNNIYVVGTIAGGDEVGANVISMGNYPNGGPVFLSEYIDDADFIAKYDSQGECFWAQSMNPYHAGDNEGMGNSICVDDAGHSYEGYQNGDAILSISQHGGNYTNQFSKFSEPICGLPGARILSLDTLGFQISCYAAQETLWVHNIGSCPLYITSGAINGQNAKDFTLDSIPSEINGCDSSPAFITFTPATAGVKSAELDLSNNDKISAHRLWRIDLKGVQTIGGIVTDKDSLVFGNLVNGGTRDSFVVVYNTGNLSETIQLNIHPPFRTDSNSITIPPGDSVAVAIHYNPTMAGNDTGSLQLTIAIPCLVTMNVALFGQASGNINLCLALSPQIAVVNQLLNVDVILSQAIPLPIDSLLLQIRYNPYTLSFQAAASSDCQITERNISDSIEQIVLQHCTSLTPGTLCTAVFLPLATSADTTYTQITLDSIVVYPLADAIAPPACQVPLTILPLCDIHGVIYIDSATTLSQNYPNPFAGSTSLHVTLAQGDEAGAHLFIYNMLGERIADLTNQLTLNSDITFTDGELASGVYYYVLETASGRLTREMFVVR